MKYNSVFDEKMHFVDEETPLNPNLELSCGFCGDFSKIDSAKIHMLASIQKIRLTDKMQKKLISGTQPLPTLHSWPWEREGMGKTPQN